MQLWIVGIRNDLKNIFSFCRTGFCKNIQKSKMILFKQIKCIPVFVNNT